MEINLLLTAIRLQLAPQLAHGELAGGLRMVKNIPERTYLAVTPKEWQILALFQEPQTVPHLLETVIEQRLCPPLGELYELVLKAVREKILVEANHIAVTVPAANWPVSLRPKPLRHFLGALLLVGLVLTAALHPAFPATAWDAFASIGALVLAVAAGIALSASLLRGAGGEVYVSRGWFVSVQDACMLAPDAQRQVLLAPVTILATATGFLTWQRPEWSFFPLVGLLIMLRPILGGRIGRIIQAAAPHRLSDAQHSFIFPLNRTPRMRWRLLRYSLRHSATWKEIGYGIIWTLALGYFVGVLTDVPPWTLAFWETRGPWLLATIAASLLILATVYLGSEFYLYARERAIARRDTMRVWYRRWFQRQSVSTGADARLRAVLRSPLLRLLPPPEQTAVANALQPHFAGALRTLHAFDEPVTHVSLILSGKVGVYRKLPSGRRTLVQVLCEDDLVGLHAIADPKHPQFLYRTLTPVVLLRLPWDQAEKALITRLSQAKVSNLVQKLPFLTRLTLCQNWHVQAIQRFAELSVIVDYVENDVIVHEDFYNESFFIMLEGTARITRHNKPRGKVAGGDFFGEIGLLQNSNPTAQVTANHGARCLSIQRKEFLRFVAHNYSVALELERVSSARLGRPIFPMTPGDFRSL